MAGEADGALKYDMRLGGDRTLWKEKRRQEWFEEVVDVPVLRFIDEEVRLAPADVYDALRAKGSPTRCFAVGSAGGVGDLPAAAARIRPTDGVVAPSV